MNAESSEAGSRVRERATLRNWGYWKQQKPEPLDSGEHIHTRVEIRSRAGDQGMNEGSINKIGNASILAQHSGKPALFPSQKAKAFF